MEDTKKLGWLEQLKIACTKPKQYKRLLEIGKGRVFVFFLFITLAMTVLGFGMDTVGLGVSVGGPKNFIMNRLPAFELRDGKLQVEEAMDFTIAGIHVAADTKDKTVDTDEFSNDYAMEIFFAQDEMVVKNSSVSMINKISFKDFEGAVVNNASLARMVPIMYIMWAFMFVFAWIVNIVSYLIFCVFISCLAQMSLRMQKQNIKFGQIFQLSIYARVIFQLIETLGTTAGYSIFSGMVWMFISYMGSYELLLLAFAKEPVIKREE